MKEIGFYVFMSIMLGFVAVLYISDFIRVIYEEHENGLTWKESFKKAAKYYFYTE